MVRAFYSVIAQCWFVLFGDNIATASILPIGYARQTHFNSKKELRKALKQCGLVMDKKGFISVKPGEESHV